MLKQARNRFRPISESQIFLGEFLGNSLRFFEILWEFFRNSLGILYVVGWVLILGNFDLIRGQLGLMTATRKKRSLEVQG